MRLLFVSLGKKMMSDLNPNFVDAFRRLEKEIKNFSFEKFYYNKEPIKNLDIKVQNFKPDIILVFEENVHFITKKLKKYRIPLGFWVVNDPYNSNFYRDKVLDYDFVITEDSGALSFYKQRGKPTIHFPLATNPKNYHPVKSNYQYDICFVGNGWPQRIIFFDKLIPWIKKRKLRLKMVGLWWKKLKHYKQVKGNILEKVVGPSEVSKYYSQSKIVLNVHRTKNDVQRNPENLPANTPNNRTFDIAACRAFQLISHRSDLPKFYVLDKEIVSYHNFKDITKKSDYYLKNDKLREQIAMNAYKRTLRDHTYYVRLKGLIRQLGMLHL